MRRVERILLRGNRTAAANWLPFAQGKLAALGRIVDAGVRAQASQVFAPPGVQIRVRATAGEGLIDILASAVDGSVMVRDKSATNPFYATAAGGGGYTVYGGTDSLTPVPVADADALAALPTAAVYRRATLAALEAGWWTTAFTLARQYVDHHTNATYTLASTSPYFPYSDPVRSGLPVHDTVLFAQKRPSDGEWFIFSYDFSVSPAASIPTWNGRAVSANDMSQFFLLATPVSRLYQAVPESPAPALTLVQGEDFFLVEVEPVLVKASESSTGEAMSPLNVQALDDWPPLLSENARLTFALQTRAFDGLTLGGNYDLANASSYRANGRSYQELTVDPETLEPSIVARAPSALFTGSNTVVIDLNGVGSESDAPAVGASTGTLTLATTDEFGAYHSIGAVTLAYATPLADEYLAADFLGSTEVGFGFDGIEDPILPPDDVIGQNFSDWSAWAFASAYTYIQAAITATGWATPSTTSQKITAIHDLGLVVAAGFDASTRVVVVAQNSNVLGTYSGMSSIAVARATDGVNEVTSNAVTYDHVKSVWKGPTGTHADTVFGQTVGTQISAGGAVYEMGFAFSLHAPPWGLWADRRVLSLADAIDLDLTFTFANYAELEAATGFEAVVPFALIVDPGLESSGDPITVKGVIATLVGLNATPPKRMVYSRFTTLNDEPVPAAYMGVRIWHNDYLSTEMLDVLLPAGGEAERVHSLFIA